jgi:hypothetical protein
MRNLKPVYPSQVSYSATCGSNKYVQDGFVPNDPDIFEYTNVDVFKP